MDLNFHIFQNIPKFKIEYSQEQNSIRILIFLPLYAKILDQRVSQKVKYSFNFGHNLGWKKPSYLNLQIIQGYKKCNISSTKARIFMTFET